MTTAAERMPPTPLAQREAAIPALGVPGLRARRPVSWRSVLLGLAAVVFVCTLTPYNNYVVANTDFVGNHLPVGLLLFFLVLIMLVNAPLSRWAPSYALSSGELAVALGMGLMGCALPSVGLMRYLPGHLTGLFHLAGTNRDYLELLQKLRLPDWMFPTFATSDLAARGNDPIVRDYVTRIAVEEDTFAAHFRAIPWAAWATPALTWGLFFGGLYGAIVCMSVIFRHQFVENERLPFPLATVYLSLIETPRPGQAFNSLFRARSFWIAFAGVFFLHSFNGLNAYYPRYWPQIPLWFNLNSIFGADPWRYTEWGFKSQAIYFTIIGIFYFVQTKVAFSLWFFFIAVQVARMVLGSTYQTELSEPMESDQLFGAVIPFGIAILWVARRHLGMVLGQMFRGPARHEPHGRYLPYRAAGWGLVLCLCLLVIWLMAAGASFVGAAVVVVMLMWLYMVLVKIVAETGLLYVLIPVRVTQPWDFMVGALSASSAPRTTLSSYFFASFFSGILTHDLRESPPVFVTHAMRVADGAAYPEERGWKRAIPFTLALLLALAVAYVVAGASMLYADYTYAATLDKAQTAPICWWGAQGMPQWIVLEPAVKYSRPPVGDAHNRALHFGLGAVITSLLSFLRLRYAGWPLHPVGFLMVYTWGVRMIWFSIFIGWLVKAVMVRFGGAMLYRQSRNFFIGLAIGEAAAAAFWLSVSLARVWMGLEYHAIRLLPA